MDNHHKDIIKGIFFPALFVIFLWIILLYDNFVGVNFSRFGIYPRHFSGLSGVLFSPLIHGGYSHLFSNTIPLLVLGWIIFYMYKPIAFSIFFWIYFMSGLWVWIAGRREVYHIGASGLIYGFVCFLFFSGIIRKDKRLMALSLLVTFIYGGLVWGILPVKESISFESHLMGSIAGVITAIHFRKEGPQATKYDWEDEPDDEDIVLGAEAIENEKPPDKEAF